MTIADIVARPSAMHIVKLPDARYVTARYLCRHEVAPLISIGIVNPFGPTLLNLAIVEDDTSAPPTVLMSRLHPFQPKLAILGHVFPAHSGSGPPVDQIVSLFDAFELAMNSTPTLLLGGAILSADEELELEHQLLARHRSGLPDVLESVRQHPGDPWTRVERSVRKFEEASLSAVRDGPDCRDRPAGLSGSMAQVDELLPLLVDPINALEELKAFAVAWRGALDLQEQSANGLPVALTVDDLLAISNKILVTPRTESLQ